MIPTFSIITVVYRGEAELQATMDSLFSQSCKDYEYIVIDGGSEDGTVSILEANASRITYWVSESDNGIYNAMNKGLKVANGQWVYFLNCGDRFDNANVLADVLPFLRSNPHDIAAGKVKVVSEAGVQVGIMPKVLPLTAEAPRLFFKNHLCHQALFVSREAYLKAGGFNESFPTFSDFNTCYKIIKESGGILPMPIIIAEFKSNGVSSNKKRARELFIEAERIFSENGDKSCRLKYSLGYIKAFLYAYLN